MTIDPHTTIHRETFSSKSMDGQVLKELLQSSLTWLRTNQQTVNSLNVFPVPDGDTGTNMVLTLQSAVNEIQSSTETNVGAIIHSVANGALMGARGNSGVILSQLLRGFARALDHQSFLDAESLVKAFQVARDTAYKGVVRPVEGTILTVAKDVASAVEAALDDSADVVSILDIAVHAADISVQHTPELLPVLKEAGVVDSGGKGLFFILEGMLRFIDGESLDTALTTVPPLSHIHFDNALESIEPGQDFEIVVDFRPHTTLELPIFYDNLEDMGTSIQIGEGDGVFRLHIHVPTEKRYHPIDYIMQLGTVTTVTIENLLDQVVNSSNPCLSKTPVCGDIEPGQIAVVAVSPGLGISRVFASLGAAAIVEGGQTMNPSTQEIVHAFEDLPTDRVIILPNNKNIVMAARIAAGLTVKKAVVIPSTTIPQGLAAILRHSPDGEFDEVVEDMMDAFDDVQTGEITTATRNVEIDGVQVEEGQIIALLNGKLVYSTTDLSDACINLLNKAQAENYELITLFSGLNVTPEEVEQICQVIQENFPDQEVEIQEGCQPHYQFIISIE